MAIHAHLTNYSRKSLTFFIILFSGLYSAPAQKILEQINSNQIKTVQLYRTGWELSEPVILLGSDEKLTFSFDDLSNDVKNYNYSVVHLSAQNEPSLLQTSEFVKSFPHIPLDDYKFSFNTTRGYIHYNLMLPNNDLEILISGNYALLVYEDYDASKPIIVKHFKVTEQAATIMASVRFPQSGLIRDTHHQLNIKINHPNLKINNPLNEVKLVVSQNGRRDNIVTNIKPNFIKPAELVYDYQDALIFDAGNEYRWLDIRSTRFIAENVRQVVFANPYYHVQLSPDDIKWKKRYFRRDDSNGRFVVSVREYDNANINADYLFVHFELPFEAPMINGELFVFGQLTDWQMNNDNRMTYNFNNHCYELTLPLKQGFYNYLYAFREKGKTTADFTFTEGLHAATENEYHIYSYFRGPSDRYDRLIAYSVVNSKNIN